MHHANHFYGHAHILARYCGLRGSPRISGYVQHGWNILDGYAVNTPIVPGQPLFVWSNGPRRRGWSLGRRAYYVIGAPWTYLMKLKPALGQLADDQREGTIWYPFHGWERQRITGDYRRLIAEILEVESGPITVCLYWNEYRDPEIKGLFEEHGLRVICHGYRGYWWQKTDTRFLERQLTELRRHRRVASNRLSSAIFYGLAAGCEPAVYGDPMVLGNESPSFGGVARIRRLWPELHGHTVDLGRARELAALELGLDHMADPGELRGLFRWPEPQLEGDTDV